MGGEFNAIVRGNSSVDSVLNSRTMQVQISEEVRRQTFVQIVNEDRVERAVVVAPSARLKAEWCVPLPGSFAVSLIEGNTPPRVVTNAQAESLGTQRVGS